MFMHPMEDFRKVFISKLISEIISITFLFIAEIAVTKDNPAFSMINDSDEEVVYGSEDESRRPLTVAGKNDYDSD